MKPTRVKRKSVSVEYQVQYRYRRWIKGMWLNHGLLPNSEHEAVASAKECQSDNRYSPFKLKYRAVRITTEVLH